MLFRNWWTTALTVVGSLFALFWLYVLASSGTFGLFLATIILGTGLAFFFAFMDRVGFRLFVTWLAEKDVWYSPYRMEIGPGHLAILTIGKEPGGPFDRVLAGHIPYWHYHEGDRRFYREFDSPIEGDPPFAEKFPNGVPVRTGRLAEWGVVWVGFFRRFYKRKRKWDTWGLKENSTEYGVIKTESKQGEEHIFYFSTTVALELVTIPTKDNYPAQMKVVENLLLIHPEKAEFLAGKWEVQGIAATRARAREFIARKKVAELRDERDGNKKDDFVDAILKANRNIPGETGTVGLLDEYGIIIQGPYYVDFDLESGNQAMTEAMQKQMIAAEDIKTARLRKEETVIKAEAEKERIRIEAEGARDARKAEAEGIRAEFAARTSVKEGAELSWAEAVKSASPKYISLGRDGKGGIMVGVSEEE